MVVHFASSCQLRGSDMFCEEASHGFCAKCYSGARGRTAYRGHNGWRRVRPIDKEKRMLRRAADSMPGEYISLDVASGGSWAEKYKALWAFLAAFHYEDGDTRQTGTMLLFVEQGRVKACLNDRECGDVCFVTAGDIEALLARVDEGLGQGSHDWRPTKPKGNGKR